MSSAFAEKCPGCGARSITVTGRCAHCGTSVKPSFPIDAVDDDSSYESDSEFALQLDKRIAIVECERSIKFLEQQFQDTGHPSIPLKIEIAKKKLILLKQSENAS